MLCGTGPFDSSTPSSNSSFTEEKHLASIISLIGSPPQDLLERGKRRSQYFHDDGIRYNLVSPENALLTIRQVNLNFPISFRRPEELKIGLPPLKRTRRTCSWVLFRGSSDGDPRNEELRKNYYLIHGFKCSFALNEEIKVILWAM